MLSGRSVDMVQASNDVQVEEPPMLRLAVISSPRSGNTWVREMLAALYGLEQIPVPFPHEIPWENLPRRCVIQIHWHPWQDFTELLKLCGVRVVVVARHPFDVLLSYLNYNYYVHQEGICSGDGGCNQCAIVGATPRSKAFLDYVMGEHGQILLGHTRAWWERPEALRIRYTDLVADAERALGTLIQQIGEPPQGSIAEAVEANTIRRLKPNREVWQYHFWQGRPGLWRSMIPKAEAELIASAHREVFEILDYPCDPDPTLEPLQADLNWLQLQLNSAREHLGLEQKKHRAIITEARILGEQFQKTEQFVSEQAEVLTRTCGELATTRMQLQAEINGREASEQAYQELHAGFLLSQGELNRSRGELHTMRDELNATNQRLTPLDELGPRALKWALRVKRLYRKVKRTIVPKSPSATDSGPSPMLFRRPRVAANRAARRP